MEEQETSKLRPKRRFRRGLLLLAACIVLLGIFVYSPIFTLQQIYLEGNVYLTRDDIVSISEIHQGQPIFSLQTDEIKKRLMEDLRIEEAVVRRSLPNALVVDIKERRPIVTVGCDYGYLDLDRKGKVIDSYRTLKAMAIPMLTGIQIRGKYVGDDVVEENVVQMLAFLQMLDENSLGQISEISLANPDSIVMYTTSSVQIRLGKMERMEEKARLAKDFLEEIKTTKHAIEFVDFTYTAPFIKLAQ